MSLSLQLWCAAGVDLTGWRTSSQESGQVKVGAGGSDPLRAEDNDSDKKNNSPEKRKVHHRAATARDRSPSGHPGRDVLELQEQSRFHRPTLVREKTTQR